MNHVLITGATGFIGQQLVSVLRQRGCQIRILSRHSSSALNLTDDIEVFTGDLTDPSSLHGLCTDIDTIFHLAGFAHADASHQPEFVQKHHFINYKGTENVLNLALAASVKRFVFFSSVKAVADNSTIIDESWQKLPTTPYGIAKRNAEDIVLQASSEIFHTTVLRLSLVYGSGWKGNLANMLRAIDKKRFPPIPETNNIRSMVSVDDVCQAAILAATASAANGKIYYVTDGKPYSTRYLYELMSQALCKNIPRWHIPLIIFRMLGWLGDQFIRITGRRFPINSDALSKLFGSAWYDASKIQAELGYIPSCTLADKLPEIIDAYRKQGAVKGSNTI